MDLKHDTAYMRGGPGPGDGIKSESRVHSPCFGAPEISVGRPLSVVASNGLFSGLGSSKTLRSDDWLSTAHSPNSHSHSGHNHNPTSQTSVPLTPSPGPPANQFTVISSNGYSSPMSSGSYDPYSPTNGRIGKSDNICHLNRLKFNFV